MGLPLKMNPFSLSPIAWGVRLYCEERRLAALGNRITTGK